MTAGVLAITVAAVAWYISNEIPKRITKQVEQIEALDIGEVEVNIWRGTCLLTDVRYRDTLNYLDLSIRRVQIRGIRWMSLMLKNFIHIDQIELDSGYMHVDLRRQFESSDSSDLFAIDWHIESMHAKSVDVSIFDEKNNEATAYINLLKTGQLMSEDPVPSILALSMTNLLFENPSDIHHWQADQLRYDRKIALLTLTDLKYNTPISEDALYSSLKTKTARYDLQLDSVHMEVFVMDSIIDHRVLSSQHIHVNGGRLTVFEDQRFIHCDTCKKMLLQEKLAKSNWLIDINKISVRDLDLIYRSKQQGVRQLAELKFSDTYMSCYDVSNLSPRMVVDAKTTFMNKSPLEVSFIFNNQDPFAPYRYHGQIKNLDLLTLSHFLLANKSVKVKSGYSDLVTFDIRANRIKSTGKLRFNYQQLSIDFNNEKKNNLLSGLINMLAVHSSNPKRGAYRVGTVYHQRDQSRSIFHSLSQSLNSGIQSTTLKNAWLPDELQPSIEKHFN